MKVNGVHHTYEPDRNALFDRAPKVYGPEAEKALSRRQIRLSELEGEWQNRNRKKGQK